MVEPNADPRYSAGDSDRSETPAQTRISRLSEIVVDTIRAGLTDFDSVIEVMLRRADAEQMLASLTWLALQELARHSAAGKCFAADGSQLPVFALDRSTDEQSTNRLRFAIVGER